MSQSTLPTPEQMHRALDTRDATLDGVFVAGVRTTGVFCRPTCPARTPLPENVEYFATPAEAALAGYRPCKRCRPLAPDGGPSWLAPLLDQVEQRGPERWRDRDLRALGLEPGEVRGWFAEAHGLTFHAYARARAVKQAFSGASFEALFGPADDAAAIVAAQLSSPLGAIVVAATETGICLLEFGDRPMLRTQLKRLRDRIGTGIRPGRNRWIDQLEVELGQYFEGARRDFDVATVSPGSPFQEAVWNALRTIPYGERRNYTEIAAAVGRPDAVRAVGKTNGDNRISILIPCHRVVGADGSLRGYGGGVWRKERLLALEAS